MSNHGSPPPSPPLRIQRVENFGQWFETFTADTVHIIDVRRTMDATSSHMKSRCASFPLPLQTYNTNAKFLGIVSYLYNKKIGQLGCIWDKEGVPIEYKYAKVTFGELFEFYTAADGVLRLPDWYSLKYAIDQYLEEEPRLRFHPTRVKAFIEENGVDQLEWME